MSKKNLDLGTLLISGISQFEVDFVIPQVGRDVPLGIDPFLMFKSRDSSFRELHQAILIAFNTAVQALANGDSTTASYLFDFPEVPEVGLGYTKKGRRGSGIGSYLSELIIETLQDTPALLVRGVRHIEEMQLVSVGIAADRTSDIVANLIKKFLIQYTQEQSQLWNLPLQRSVPIEHIFDLDRLEWYDDYVDLPISPLDNSPLLFVPRRIVRTLPWINYDDYFRMEFSAYLRAKRVKARLGHKKQTRPDKEQIVQITRSEADRIDRYVDAKEHDAAQAQPSLTYLNEQEVCPEAERLKERLTGLDPGVADAAAYQRLVLEILNYLFSPELIDGTLEVATIDGTERRDIIFTNDSDQSFWDYVRSEHSSFLIMFETKNTVSIKTEHLNQTAVYLGERIGRLGFIVTRSLPGEAAQRKAFSIYNDSHPRKIVLFVTDDDLSRMIDMRCSGNNPMRHVQHIYRRFRQTVQ